MDFPFEIYKLCHFIYDPVYRNNQQEAYVTTPAQLRMFEDAVRNTHRIISFWTRRCTSYLSSMKNREMDRGMHHILVEWTDKHFKDLQDILRGGQKSYRSGEQQTLLKIAKKSLTRMLNNVGISYFFRRERRALYDAFFKGWKINQSFDSKQMDHMVIGDISNLLQSWNEVLYEAPRLQEKIIMYRGFSFDICEHLKTLRVGDTFTEYGFMSLSINRGTAEQYASYHTDGVGYVAGFEITPHTPILYIESISKANPREYEGLICCGAVFEKIGYNYFRIKGYDRTRTTAEWIAQDSPSVFGRIFGFGKKQKLMKESETFTFSSTDIPSHVKVNKRKHSGLLKEPEHTDTFTFSGTDIPSSVRFGKRKHSGSRSRLLKEPEHTPVFNFSGSTIEI